jgi:hypothetical protein
MLDRILCLAAALTVALGVVWVAMADSPEQTPGQKGGPPPRVDDRGGPGGGFRRGPGGRGGPGGEFRPGGGIERALDDLKLADKKKDQAEAVVRAHQADVRKLMDLARSDLQLKMMDVLSEPELKQFNEALARRPGPADSRRGRGGRFPGGRGLTVDQIVERIMSFDKNKDGKITKDELPERMQDLIAKGDTNKDGALDKDEIKKLATELARNGSFRGFDGRGGPGEGFRRGPGGRFLPGNGLPPGGEIERALADLRLADKKKDQAEAAVRAHQENARKLMDVARADLLVKMKGVLSEDEFKTFKAAVAPPPSFGGRPPGLPPAGASRPGDLERKLDQLQNELNNLRREIRR